MFLPVRTFDQIVQAQVAQAQASNPNLTDVGDGSALNAIFEANAHQSNWLQYIAFLVLSATRLSTCVGDEVDSFVADYGLSRLPGSSASGTVTFSRATTGSSMLVPIGAQVKTADGAQVFSVIFDASNPKWSAAQNGYVSSTTDLAMNVPVLADVPGGGGNVLANTITLISGVVSGAASVANTSAFTNGVAVESDDNLKARFTAYINTRSKGTDAAVRYAATSVQQGLTVAVRENINTAGATEYGTFTVYIDDGSGTPSSDLLTRVASAIALVKPLTTRCYVLAPTVVSAAVAVTFTEAAGYARADAITAISTAISTYVNGLGMGQPLSYFKLVQVIQDSSPGIGSIQNVLVNAGTASVGGSPNQTVHTSTVTIS